MSEPIYLVFRTSNMQSARVIQHHVMMIGAEGKAFTIEGLAKTAFDELNDNGIPTPLQWMTEVHGGWM